MLHKRERKFAIDMFHTRMSTNTEQIQIHKYYKVVLQA